MSQKSPQSKNGDAYATYISGGQVLFEGINNDNSVSYEKDIFKIAGTGKASKTQTSILINGKEKAPQKDGLNVVVYNKKEKKVIDSAVFTASG